MQREKEQQVNIRQRELEGQEKRAQYAAEMETKRERSEAIVKERENTIQKASFKTSLSLGLTRLASLERLMVRLIEYLGVV